MPRTPKEYQLRYIQQYNRHLERAKGRIIKLRSSFRALDPDIEIALREAQDDLDKAISRVEIIHSLFLGSTRR